MAQKEIIKFKETKKNKIIKTSLSDIIRDTGRKKGLLLLAIPGILFLFIFNYLPIFGVFIAFKSLDLSKGIFGSPWVGLDNFKFFFKSEDMIRVTRNTLLENSMFISVTLILSIIFALILFELSKRAVKLYQTLLFIPYLLSWVMISYITYILLNGNHGVVNDIAQKLTGGTIDWYTEPKYWPIILLVSYVWKNIGYTTIIFYTGLIGIDSTLYEAGEIDGADKRQQIFNITIPCITPLISIMLLTQIGRIFFSDFGLFYFVPMNSKFLYPATDVIDTFVYRSLQSVGDPGMAAAVGLYQSLVGFAIVVAVNAVVKKINPDNALF